MFYNNIVKISENLYKQNLLKTYLQLTYPTNFCIICSQFYYGEKVKICVVFFVFFLLIRIIAELQ